MISHFTCLHVYLPDRQRTGWTAGVTFKIRTIAARMFENTAANVNAVLAVQRQFRAKQQRREASKANKPNIRRLESRRISDDDELQGLRRERYAKANADPSAELPAAAASRGTRRSPVNYAQWKFQRDTLDETKQQGSSCWFSCQQFARRSVLPLRCACLSTMPYTTPRIAHINLACARTG